MTIGNSLSSSSYSSSNVHSQSGASGISSSAQSYSNVASQMAASLMTSMDTNKDNSIDQSEFKSAIDALSGNASSSSSNADKIFSALDTNKDGTISSDELLSALQQSQSSNDTAATKVSTQKSIEDLQSNLLQKILAAYGNTDTTSSATTTLTA